MIAYKLFTKRANKTLGPLFINRRQVIELGKWLRAEAHKTKGFAFRPGWHASVKKSAPHLSKKGRVWCRVDVRNFETYNRPKSQGGQWVIAKRIKVLEVL
jgi:hypothetical protein